MKFKTPISLCQSIVPFSDWRLLRVAQGFRSKQALPGACWGRDVLHGPEGIRVSPALSGPLSGERSKERTSDGHHYFFSERTNLHITARRKAIPHQAPFREFKYTYLVSKSVLQNKWTHSTWSSFQFLWPVLFHLIKTIFAAEHGLVCMCGCAGTG